jgi:hypothetical protein
MLSAGREVKIEIPICTCHFKSKKKLYRFGEYREILDQQSKRQNTRGSPMKVVGRKIVVGVMACAVISIITLISFSITGKLTAAQKKGETGQWVDPANPSDELVEGPYLVDPNWPKPLATLFPEEKGWTWGAVQGVFAQNPDRIFVAMRGELPDVAKIKPKFAELENEFGMTVHLQVPGTGMYARNTSVGQYASPGEASDDYLGIEGKDYR